MLVLSRTIGEHIQIVTASGETIWVSVCRSHRGKIRIGVTAQPNVRIMRAEILEGMPLPAELQEVTRLAEFESEAERKKNETIEAARSVIRKGLKGGLDVKPLVTVPSVGEPTFVPGKQLGSSLRDRVSTRTRAESGVAAGE